ncbi:AAA family ATPase [Nocardia mexicana]|uniref:AAA domain-containing protein n=1 Tax=Nocardia mexicana TaxID=279262 RepID=A0A370GU79_9NOCA|nr:AAA family ATPase [Nocardia mexicana]RDI47255.1 AAA domain-containing protein [Nocardia mexicana]
MTEPAARPDLSREHLRAADEAELGEQAGGGAVYLITGIQAAGKSTVAQALAERLPRSAHVRGDTYRRSVVSGSAEMSPDPSPEALAQLRLRHRLAAQVADGYAAEGFTAVLQDTVLGELLPYTIEQIRTRPLYVVVLAPRPEAIERREAGRGKKAYGTFTVADLDKVLHAETPRLGLWLDSSDLTVDQTVDEILARAGANSV